MLKDEIYRRIAVRKYQEEALNHEIIKEIKSIINNQKPLFKDMTYKIDLVQDGKPFQKVLGGIIGSYGKVHAPHYLVASVKKEDNAYENIGYLLEYVVLKLTEMNIGSCWIGGGIKKDLFKNFLEIEDELHPIVVIAFGKPLHDVFRTSVKQFKRKSVNQIAKGTFVEDYQGVMELVRLAPSAVNLQPWRYYCDIENQIDLYRVKHNFLLKSHFDEMNRLDLGISICHLEIGLNDLSKKFKIVDSKLNKANLIYYKSFQII